VIANSGQGMSLVHTLLMNTRERQLLQYKADLSMLEQAGTAQRRSRDPISMTSDLKKYTHWSVTLPLSRTLQVICPTNQPKIWGNQHHYPNNTPANLDKTVSSSSYQASSNNTCSMKMKCTLFENTVQWTIQKKRSSSSFFGKLSRL
jgi:hypothetical protein